MYHVHVWVNVKLSKYDYDDFMLKNEVITYEVHEELICIWMFMKNMFMCFIWRIYAMYDALWIPMKKNE